jgi:hypothetical protein
VFEHQSGRDYRQVRSACGCSERESEPNQIMPDSLRPFDPDHESRLFHLCWPLDQGSRRGNHRKSKSGGGQEAYGQIRLEAAHKSAVCFPGRRHGPSVPSPAFFALPVPRDASLVESQLFSFSFLLVRWHSRSIEAPLLREVAASKRMSTNHIL